MRTKKTPKTPTVTAKADRVFDTLANAASSLGLELAVLKAAKRAGCPAFVHGRVHEAVLVPWLEEHGKELADLAPKSLEGVRIAEGLEKIRERRRKNDVAEGRLVQRAWVVERFQRLAGELNGLRSRSEGEHPVAMAGAGDDLPANREVLKGIWDDIFRGIRDLGRVWEESK